MLRFYAAAGAVGLALLVTGCGGGSGDSFSTYADVVPDGFVSIADGRAAFAGRDILALDGTAADAAVAAAMVLAVVDPAAAGLGGGGACLVHDSFAGETRLLDFLPVAPAATDSPAKTVVPGSVRGLFTLSRQYGRLEWQQLLEPAARLARFGSLVDAGLAGDLAAAAGRLHEDRSARAIYFADGAPHTTGSDIAQLELSATLARLTRNGAGDFYAGGVAAALSHGAVAVGLTLERRDLAAFQPVWRVPESRQIDALTVESAATIEQPAAVASVGLTVADAEGLWVACALGMGSPFGSARMAENTGVFLAGPSVGPWLGGAGPVLLRDGDTVLGIAAGGAGAALPGLVAAAKDGGAPLGYGAAVLCPSGAFSSAACTTSGTGR